MALETSPSHPTECCANDRSVGRLDMALETSASHPDGMLRKRPLFPLSKGPLQGANYLIINCCLLPAKCQNSISFSADV